MFVEPLKVELKSYSAHSCINYKLRRRDRLTGAGTESDLIGGGASDVILFYPEREGKKRKHSDKYCVYFC